MDSNLREMLESIAEQAAEKAVRRVLLEIGVDHRDPIATQKEFLTLRDLTTMMHDPEYQKDMLHLRRWRKATDSVVSKGVIASLSLLMLGIMGLILYAVKSRLFGIM